MNEIEFAAIISFALLSSLGHCVGMCGGFIVTYTTAKINQSMTKGVQAFAHLFYNSGRVVTYTIIGALFGYFGSLWDITPLTRAIMFAIIGVLMVLMGLSFAGQLKFLNSIEFPIANFRWFKLLFKSLLSSERYSSFFLLGMLNGIIPCGLVYMMLTLAMKTQSALDGALVMAVFGMFTMPTLFVLGFSVGLFSQTYFRSIMVKIAAIIIILFGFWTLRNAYLQFDFWRHSNTTKQTEQVSEPAMKCGAGKCAAGKCGMGKCGAQN